jgi:hypothetical protein
LKKTLPQGSNASKILGCFSDNFEFGPVVEKKLIRLADKSESTIYHMCLATIDISLSKREISWTGIDQLTLYSIARLVTENPVFSQRSFRSIRQGDAYIIDGIRLREVVEEELSAAGIVVKESLGIKRENGWPDRIEVKKEHLSSRDNFLSRGMFDFFHENKIWKG